jgi:transposase-like protein
MSASIELLTNGRKGRRRYRRRSDEEKARTVAETLGVGASVREVGARHGLKTNQTPLRAGVKPVADDQHPDHQFRVDRRAA